MACICRENTILVAGSWCFPLCSHRTFLFLKGACGPIARRALSSLRPRLLRAPRSAGLALLWLISLNARQQLFFQPSPALLEPLNFRLATNFRLVTLKEVDDVAVLVTKRVEAFVRRH